MAETEPTKHGPSRRERTCAFVRIVLGQAQIFAAVIGLVLFAATGLSGATMTTVVIAGLLVVLSKLLFRTK